MFAVYSEYSAIEFAIQEGEDLSFFLGNPKGFAYVKHKDVAYWMVPGGWKIV